MEMLLYVVPDLNKVSGGPLTRISSFIKTFTKNNSNHIKGSGFTKIKQAIDSKKIDLLYVESASNRIRVSDLIALLMLRVKSKYIIVFIRDIYIELFPEEYKTLRKKVTYYSNKLSNRFFHLIADELAFPTHKMGAVYYDKNKFKSSKSFFALPPGTIKDEESNLKLNLTKKPAILYLGSIDYVNSGFERYIEFAKNNSDKYNFHVLSGSKKIEEKIRVFDNESLIIVNKVPYELINSYIYENNILFAIHTRPRNDYDDITFPIKVLDFVGLNLPFISEKHDPIVKLMGENYQLFVNELTNESIKEKIEYFSTENRYKEITRNISKVSNLNSYDRRFQTIKGRV